MKAITLSELVDEYISSARSNGYAEGTMSNISRGTRGLLETIGNIRVSNIRPQHIDQYFAARLSRRVAAGTLNNELIALRGMFAFAIARRYIPATGDPTAHRRSMRRTPREFRRLPASMFPTLLNACTHPRDRVFIALGLYLLLRAGEISALRVKHVSLDRGYVSAQIFKSAIADEMPIPSELDHELRHWLTWYAQTAGPLNPEWYLVPAKHRPQLRAGGGVDIFTPLKPTVKLTHSETIVQRALAEVGIEPRDASGRPTREGGHTLRRSAARALFDRLVEEGGRDGAGRVVQSLLHHSQFSTTERYLGIDQDRLRRDHLLKGQAMFPVGPNVIPLEVARGDHQSA